jgi:uncharacterized protein involved in exopolysaccharide biosynthesis
MLAEDSRNRTARAVDTTNFLAREVQRLESELGAVKARVAELKRTPRVPTAASDQLAAQLTVLKSDLVQKASLYSEVHPEVRALRRKIAGLEQAISRLPHPNPGENSLDEFERQASSIDKNLEEANRKLTAARLGESLERDQRSERLQIIEQPALPQSPIRPKRLKWLGIAFALAGIAGVGSAFAAETFDRSIRTSQQLAGIFDSHLIVSIPYLTTPAEGLRRKMKFVLFIGAAAIIGISGWNAADYLGMPLDGSQFMNREWTQLLRSWVDTLTRLSK